jgi:hypothetical protein
MAEAVYVLCAVTSLVCGLLLFRGYRASRTRLLLWSSLCFLGFFLNNALLFVDLVVAPQIDLSLLRNGVGLSALVLLLYGLIWDAE